MLSKNCIYCYKHDNRIIYVGQTNNLKRRHKEHMTASKTGFATYFEKYGRCVGWDNLVVEVLEKNISEKMDRNLRERFWYYELRPSCNSRIPYWTEQDTEFNNNRKKILQEERDCLAAMKI